MAWPDRRLRVAARAVEVPETLNDLALRDLQGGWPHDPSPDDIAGWVGAMRDLLADVSVGERYVCFDGLFVSTSASGLRYDGWHAAHDLPFVPQVAALDDYEVMASILTNVEYWQSNAFPDTGDT